jgi:hypothetical protein
VHTALQQNKLNGLAVMLRFIAEAFDAYGCILWRLGPGASLETEQIEGRLFVLAQWLKDERIWGSHVLPIDSNTGIAISTGKAVKCARRAEQSAYRPERSLWNRAGVTSFCSILTEFLDGHRGAVNVYRQGSTPFDDDDVRQIAEFALLVPTLYQAIRDKVSFSLAGRIKEILHAAELRSQLAEKVSISPHPAVLEPEKLIQSLYEYASGHKRLWDPARDILFNVERGTFNVLRTNEVRVDERTRSIPVIIYTVPQNTGRLFQIPDGVLYVQKDANPLELGKAKSQFN